MSEFKTKRDIDAGETKPIAPPVCFENIPAQLGTIAQWVCWRYVRRRQGKDGPWRWTKIPFDPKTGKTASSTDPSTWATLEIARQACLSEGYDGVGFVFSKEDPFCGIDLDDCVEPSTMELKDWAKPIVGALDSYSEFSPSGTGIKIIVMAAKTQAGCRKAIEDGEVEMYDQGRFFTITGQLFPDAPRTVNTRQIPFDELHASLFEVNVTDVARCTPKVSGSYELSDEGILEKAMKAARGGEKFTALWAGHWQGHFQSQSEADSSLLFTLAFYTKDAARLDQLFRRSGLMRDKWDERHGEQTYGQKTIARALEKVTRQYQPRRPSQRSAVVKDRDDGTERGDDGMIALGQRDPETGRIVLSPKRTLPTAQAFLSEHYDHPDGRTLHCYADELMIWRNNRYVKMEEGALKQQLQPWLHDALRYTSTPRGQMILADFESNPTTINASAESIRTYAHLPVTFAPTTWLQEPLADPRYLLPFPTGTLDLKTGRVLKPTPTLFNINALDFDFDPNAPRPERWIRFLEELWGDEFESLQLLQEWMGYCLVADTSQQKMLLLVGPPRSGKGTIGRVLTKLVGAGNVVGPTMSSLAGSFGLQSLINKSLAIVSDARFHGDDLGVVIERLLCISGEDTVTVDRKFLTALTMKLPTRFVFLTNELPRLSDASGALAKRFMILRLTQTFYDKEDTCLTDKLIGELPGILLWAIEGLKRLLSRGRFVQPQSVADAVRELEDLASPVLAFVRERCEVSPFHRIPIDELYRAWRSWNEEEGRSIISNRTVFGKDLAAAIAGIKVRRNSERFYEGIRLR